MLTLLWTLFFCAVYSCIGLTLVAMAYVAFLLPESAPRKRRAEAESKARETEAEAPLSSSNSSVEVEALLIAIEADTEEDAVSGCTAEAEGSLRHAGSTVIAGSTVVADSTSTAWVGPAGGRDEPAAGAGGRDKAVKGAGGDHNKPAIGAPPAPAATKASSTLAGLSRGWAVLLGSAWYLKLALIWALVCAMTGGAQVGTKRWSVGVMHLCSMHHPTRL